MSRASRPARWEPPSLEHPDAMPERVLHDPPARHFGTTAIPARHHWVLDTLMVLGGVVVLLILFVA